MAPGGVGTHKHDEIGLIEILIGSGHQIAAKGALVASDRRGHAEPRIGVHIRRPQKALHQFVGDVIILRQQLPREIKGKRVRPMGARIARKVFRDRIQRNVPSHALIRTASLAHHGMQQTPFKRHRLAQRRALGAQSTKICRMIGITCNGDAADAVRRCKNPAAHAAIGAGRADSVHGRCAIHHGFLSKRRPDSGLPFSRR